ncbi:hypothetical protein Pcinc_040885 [Petrolisthes cinctipes]|uniref:Uncharacterized protein n=1 Tax=Petrolisthes cinctipes TaxID=88211 RepID=A0AAE1BPF7_PETCI|nr:hypothetical protein Pcinc_040885 [Petrolisthes cinctipes]
MVSQQRGGPRLGHQRCGGSPDTLTRPPRLHFPAALSRRSGYVREEARVTGATGGGDGEEGRHGSGGEGQGARHECRNSQGRRKTQACTR